MSRPGTKPEPKCEPGGHARRLPVPAARAQEADGPFSSAYVDDEMAEFIHRGHVPWVNQDRGTDFFHDCRSLQPLSGAEPAAQEDGTQNRPLSAIECDLPQTLFPLSSFWNDALSESRFAAAPIAVRRRFTITTGSSGVVKDLLR